MTGAELAKLIAPLLGIGARDRIRALASEAVGDIAIRWDEVTGDPWEKLLLIIVKGDITNTINLYDGEEWFLLEPVGANDGPNRGASPRDRVVA